MRWTWADISLDGTVPLSVTTPAIAHLGRALPVHHRHQVEEATRYWNVADVGRQHLVDPLAAKPDSCRIDIRSAIFSSQELVDWTLKDDRHSMEHPFFRTGRRVKGARFYAASAFKRFRIQDREHIFCSIIGGRMSSDERAASSDLMTVSDVANYLHIHPSTVLRFAKDGRLPGFKVGQRWRFRRREIDE